jgi:hypothetical protein
MLPPSGYVIRRYRPKWWLRIFALGFLSSSTTILVNLWVGIALDKIRPEILSIVVSALLTLSGLALSVHFFTTSVTLEGDAIEVRTFFGKKRLELSEIRSRRECETTDSDGLKTSHIVLEPLDENRPELKFQRMYDFDLAFESWLAKIPSLDG